MSALDVGYVISKLEELEGGKLEKIYQVNKKEFVFSFHKQGKVLVKAILGKGMFFVKEKEPVDKASMFSMFLRKRLKQSRLKKIYQKDFERIVIMEFDNYNIILELFSKGNLVLVDKNDQIEIVSEKQSWSGRELKKGVKYQYPESRFNLFSAKINEMRDMLSNITRQNVVKALAVDFGLGGKYAEQVCLKAEVNKKAKELTNDEISKVIEILKDLREFKFFKKNFEYEAGEEFREKSVYEVEIEKIEKVIEEQKEHLEELKKEVDLFKEIGDKIYAKYNAIEDLIKRILDNKWNINEKGVELKPAEGKVIIEL